MNAHQRRKQIRKFLKQNANSKDHFFIKDWEDLAKVPDSLTHSLEIKVEDGYGWINRKDKPNGLGRYLSTHTFYGSCYKRSTNVLRSCGFNVTLANWDSEN